MNADGYRQEAAYATVDVLSRRSSFQAAQRSFEAAAILGDVDAMNIERARACEWLNALLDATEKQSRCTRLAIQLGAAPEKTPDFALLHARNAEAAMGFEYER